MTAETIEQTLVPNLGRGLVVGVLPHPFCNPSVKGCGFCTSPHEGYSEPKAMAVTAAVTEEIEKFFADHADLSGHRVEALYFGGGTANVTPVAAFRPLCHALAGSLDLSGAEVTLEGVPAYFLDGGEERLDVLREQLVPQCFRVSMGIETFDKKQIRRMD
ncbi:MAG: hypothetical protein HY699_03315 [Deltaproteobacteria bacterium]|nr:hypothetical protein [Deltaproteobacteria bacterium]